MSNLEYAQAFGRDVLDKIEDGVRPDMLMVGMLETCMEYLAAILDELQAKKQKGESNRDRHHGDLRCR